MSATTREQRLVSEEEFLASVRTIIDTFKSDQEEAFETWEEAPSEHIYHHLDRADQYLQKVER